MMASNTSRMDVGMHALRVLMAFMALYVAVGWRFMPPLSQTAVYIGTAFGMTGLVVGVAAHIIIWRSDTS